jgi:hypothetical protein
VCGEYVCLVVRRETFTDSYRAEREGGRGGTVRENEEERGNEEGCRVADMKRM